MMTMNKKEEVIAYLNELFPNAGCELNYSNDYELLIAIILSAQCTDKRVNMVTKEMFSKYHTIYDIYNAPLEEIESDIKSVGLYKNKSKAIKEAIKIIDGRAETECSGNVTLENVARLIDIGVDYISSGALTHSAPILDVSLKHLHRI